MIDHKVSSSPHGKLGNLLLMMSFIVLSIFSTTVFSEDPRRDNLHNISTTLNHLLAGYDRRFRPLFGGQRITVQVTVFVSAFGQLNSQESLLDINFYLRQTWKDNRLAFPSNSSKKISLSPAFLQKIWIPDTTFVNVKTADLHWVTTPNQLFHLWPDGTILTSMRITVQAYCHMRLHAYPFDTQKCLLTFGSYGYDKRDIDYIWKYKDKDENLKFGEHAELQHFILKGYDTLRTEKDFGETGVFTKLTMEFTLKREIGFFIINIYFPATLLVILSWVSFWLRRNQTPARVALGITTALTLMTLISGAQSYMPKVPYIRAIDWFLIICFFCVIGALLEYAAVHYFEKNISPTSSFYMEDDLEQNGKTISDSSNTSGETNQATEDNETKFKGSTTRMLKKKMARNVSSFDQISRFAFPLTFIALNCVYWGIYLR